MRWLPLALVLACKQDVSLSEVDARLSVASDLVDVSTRLGEPLQVDVEVFHERGVEVELRGIAVTNVQGQAFSAGPFTPVTLTVGESVVLPFVYDPSDAGFHTAAFTIRTNAAQGELEVTARGRASVPEVEVFPAAVDFGPVDTAGTVTVRLDNLGLNAVQVSGTLTDPRFSAVGLPIEVPAGGFVTVPVRYHPLDTDPVSAELDLVVGASSIGTVQLRANDCEHGDPVLYDADDDGITRCAGDCDDDDPLVRPGTVELHDGLDQDCDGTVDEGTPGADADGDGWCILAPCAPDAVPGDCHDGDSTIHPHATEIVGNGIDENCDGTIAGGGSDLDGDGFAAPLDCDDADPDVHPGALELANGADDDCDGTLDEGTPAGDDDGDGYCEQAPCAGGAAGGDCDDTVASTHPLAPELADFVDNDCDGSIDEGTENEDADGDGFTPAGGDCDDTDPLVGPAYGNC